MPGTLFVVATPIGNLEDLTFRALRTLREVDLIAAEDTRRTANLLAHYEIRKPLVSVREHNEEREAPRLVARIEAGESIALVTDAGTPGISDPGARLVRAVRDRGLPIVPIPGASAITTALSVAGEPADQFVFLGFPPASGAARREWFEEIAREQRLMVFYEAPHRVRRTLSELANYVKRPITVARELTKVHEQLVYSPKYDNYTDLTDKGEFVILVHSGGIDTAKQFDDKDVIELFGRITASSSIDDELAIQILSKYLDVALSRVKNIVKKARIEAKKQQRRLP